MYWLDGITTLWTWELWADVNRCSYYSGVVLGSLHRTMAINEWVKLNNGQGTSLERALAAFDMFVLERRKGDFNEVQL